VRTAMDALQSSLATTIPLLCPLHTQLPAPLPCSRSPRCPARACWTPHCREPPRPLLGSVTEPPNYTRLSRKIIQREDNLTNLSPYNPVVREISTDFKPFHIIAKIVLSLAVTIISYINVRGIKYIRV
jgi:hypothetical protein